MSKFNSYARELDSLVKQLRDEYTQRLEAYNAARKPVNPCSDPEKEKIQSLRREAALREAKANYDAFCKAYPGELSAKAKEIRSRLVKDVNASYMANPADVDDKSVNFQYTRPYRSRTVQNALYQGRYLGKNRMYASLLQSAAI